MCRNIDVLLFMWLLFIYMYFDILGLKVFFFWFVWYIGIKVFGNNLELGLVKLFKFKIVVYDNVDDYVINKYIVFMFCYIVFVLFFVKNEC